MTFHRAFDLSPDLASSLESLADAGIQRILSSGGAATAAQGAEVLADLVGQAGSRLVVVAGGGVREENVRELVSVSGVREVHVRLTRLSHAGQISAPRVLPSTPSRCLTTMRPGRRLMSSECEALSGLSTRYPGSDL